MVRGVARVVEGVAGMIGAAGCAVQGLFNSS